MIINSIIESPNFCFRNLDENDNLDSYLNWMQDTTNHRFIDSVDKKTEIKTLQLYIQSNNQSSDSILFGIFSLANRLHIGNIRLTKIDRAKKESYIGILIGEHSFRQKGVGYETINTIMGWARQELGMHTIKLGCDIKNKPALRLYKKLGFKIFFIKLKGTQITLLMRKNLSTLVI